MADSVPFVVLCAAGALAACVALVACGARPTPPSDELTSGALPTAAQPSEAYAAAADPGTVQDGWLASFADPLLDRLVEDAMRDNRDLAASTARVAQAAAQARQAGAALKPQVNFAMGAASGGGVGDAPRTDAMGAGLSLSWELDVWGRLSSGQRAATEAYAAQEADFAFARQSLAAQVAKAYFLCIQAVKQEAIATEYAALQENSVGLIALRQQLGRASVYELALARSAAATAADQMRQAASGRERAARSLELLVGRYPKGELSVATSLPAVPPPPPAGLPSSLLERRPDLIAATRRVAAAFNQAESAKAARLPKLAITANGGAISQDFSSLSLDDVFFNLAGNLMGPIFDGGRLKEQVAIETAKQEEALALYGAAALRAFQQVEQGLSEEARLGQRLELVEAADRHQQEALRLSNLRFAAGSIDQVELLTVRAGTLEARLAAVAVRVERLTNRVDLHLALGGGFNVPPPAPEDALPATRVVDPAKK